MDALLCILPFVAAESLLVWSLWRMRPVAFVGSFLALLLAFVHAVVRERSSDFGIIGICFIGFGVTCIFLTDRAGKGVIISRRGLRGIGAILFFLGFASAFIL
jgi:hypothetical protein